jgi:hypothetical protein
MRLKYELPDYVKDVWEQGSEENIWSYGGESNQILENIT